MTDPDTLRERHQGDPYCGFIDPERGLVDHGYAIDCDTRVVLDALDAEKRQHDDDVLVAMRTKDAYDREAAHAKALAEALRDVRNKDSHWCDGDLDPFENHCTIWCDAARQVLRLYDADHREPMP